MNVFRSNDRVILFQQELPRVMKKLTCQTNLNNVPINHDPQTSYFMIHDIFLTNTFMFQGAMFEYIICDLIHVLMTARRKYIV